MARGPAGAYLGTVTRIDARGRVFVKLPRLSRREYEAVAVAQYPGTPGLVTGATDAHTHALRPPASLLKAGSRVIALLVEGNPDAVAVVGVY